MPAVGTVFRPGWSVAGEEKVSARTPENEVASGAHFRMPQWLGKPEGTVSAPRGFGCMEIPPKSKIRPKWIRAEEGRE